MGFMSRDCRKIIDCLEKLSGQKCDMEDILEAEQLTFTYYAKTICGHIGRFYNPDSKGNPNRVAFYVQPTKSINKGKRTTDIWQMSDHDKEVYKLITTKFIIEDFSLDQLAMIKEMGQYSIKIIEEGIKETMSEKIYSIIYLKRVVEGIHAKREHEKAQRQKLKELYSYQDNNDIISRSPIELASLKYNWLNTLENRQLERQAEELWKDE